MLTVELSRARQQRLIKFLDTEKLDAAVVASPDHVYYFSTFLTSWLQQSAMVITADGRSLLVTAVQPEKPVAADEIVIYESRWNATLRQEQPMDVAGHAARWLSDHGFKRIGVDASVVTSQLALQWAGKPTAIDPHLWQIRRQKDPDELVLMRKAIDCSVAMYRRACQLIRPGFDELEMFGELYQAAVLEAGEPLSAPLGNDFHVGGGGGAPRKGRKAQSGELYVLDVGPAYRGYFGDNCRTFSVDGTINDDQRRAWEAIVGVFPLIENTARTGVSCRALFDAADEHLKKEYGKPLKHHLGHGVGLQPHEYPHLNPKWDDKLLEGEVFTAEPGLYGPELRGGIRIEQNYLVTATGVQSLLQFPLEMTTK